MRDNKQPLNEKTRSLMRSKRRKTNIILNSLIVIVLLLIVFVSVNIFFSDEESSGEKKNLAGADSSIITDSKAVKSNSQLSEESKIDRNEQDEDNANSGKEEDQDEVEAKDKKKEEKADKEKDKEEKNKEDKNKEDAEDEEIVTEGGSGPDVSKTIVNPAWEPVETSQAAPNPNEYGGQNWDEMVQAITYATGIDENNMTILFLGNGGPNKSVGTIVQKDTQQKYRVYIEWVEDAGWQPTLVQELNS